jgi:hypothetical protein
MKISAVNFLGALTLGIRTFSIRTFSTMTLIAMVSVNGIEQNDTLHYGLNCDAEPK